MPRRLQVRELTEEERESIWQTARSRTAAVREVERARIIQASSEGQSVAEIASQFQFKAAKVRKWIKGFNEAGLAGLMDRGRSGRPPTYPPEEVGEVIASSLSAPQAAISESVRPHPMQSPVWPLTAQSLMHGVETGGAVVIRAKD